MSLAKKEPPPLVHLHTHCWPLFRMALTVSRRMICGMISATSRWPAKDLWWQLGSSCTACFTACLISMTPPPIFGDSMQSPAPSQILPPSLTLVHCPTIVSRGDLPAGFSRWQKKELVIDLRGCLLVGLLRVYIWFYDSPIGVKQPLAPFLGSFPQLVWA